MKNEFFSMIETVSNEKGISAQDVISSIEQSMAIAITKHIKDPYSKVTVNFDSEEFNYEIFQHTLKNTQILDEYESIEDIPEQEFKKSKLKFSQEQLGRIIAISTKKAAFFKINQKEREEIAKNYVSKIGQIYNVTIKKINRSNIILQVDRMIDGILDKSNLLPGDYFKKVGVRVRVVLEDVIKKDNQYKLIFSRTSDKFLLALLKNEVPEIDQEVIEVKGIGREPGYRAKIVVKTSDRRIDPVSACIGIRGSRVQAISNDLGGERIDIVNWSNNIGQLIVNLLSPAQVKSLVLDEDIKTIDVIVDPDSQAIAIGKNGVNVNLIRHITGNKINILTELEAEKKQNTQITDTVTYFEKSLGITKDIATQLVEFDFLDIEDIAYSDPGEFSEIQTLDLQAIDSIISKAQRIFEKEKNIQIDSEVLNLKGIDENIAKALYKNNIRTKDDIADLATDELVDLVLMSEDRAKQIIMSARAHWFE